MRLFNCGKTDQVENWQWYCTLFRTSQDDEDDNDDLVLHRNKDDASDLCLVYHL